MSDFLGQKKSLSFVYDTDMKIEVFQELPDGANREKLATFIVNGVEDVAINDVSTKEGSSKPKVSLSFELTRSGLIQLNKAEAKVDELVWIEDRTTKSKKAPKNTTNSTNSTETPEGEAPKTETPEEKKEEEVEAKPAKKLKKRTQVFPLGKIQKVFYGKQSLTKEQMVIAKERIRSYERRDEEKIRTDKAKNDFESVIYALREWINEESNQAFIKSSDVEDMMNTLMTEEDWLMDEGDHANLTEYQTRFYELNSKLVQYKSRKSEHGLRDEAIKSAINKLDKY